MSLPRGRVKPVNLQESPHPFRSRGSGKIWPTILCVLSAPNWSPIKKLSNALNWSPRMKRPGTLNWFDPGNVDFDCPRNENGQCPSRFGRPETTPDHV